MTVSRQSDEPSIVVVGDFDPRAFHPAGLALGGLLSHEEAESALLSGQAFVMEYKTSWLTVQVLPGRLYLGANDAAHVTALADLAAGILKIIKISKVSALGINRIVRYQFADAVAWHALGDSLVPKDAWSEAGLLPEGKQREAPGLTLVQVQGRRPGGDTSEYVKALLRPELEQRVVVDMNEHFSTDLAGAAKAIREQWDDAQQFFDRFADRLVGAV